ncbi:MAG: phage portal protein [Acidobacteria bacterium]|nr:phage portal protein [Acidobacteriota bacterium]
MAKLTLKERWYLARQALAGGMNVAPGSVGWDLLNRMWPGAVGDAPRRGTLQMLEAYSTSPWLRAVEGRIASGTAAVQWELYAVKRPGAAKAIRASEIQRAPHKVRKSLLLEREAAGDLVALKEHLFLTAMDRGNPYLTGLALRKLTQLYLDLTGNCYWLKERNGMGKPMAFWPLAPQWIVNLPTVTHPFFRVSARGWQADIPATEVLWMADPDPVQPYGHGTGPAQAAGDEIDTDEAMAKTVKQKFYNRARPDLVIMPKSEHDTISAPDRVRLEQQWLNESQGFWRWFKPFFASRPVEIKELSQDLQALQFVDLRKFERDTIMQVTGGIPPEMLGILESSNRATISAAKYLMDTQVLIPRLEFQRAYYQEKLIPEYDDRLIVDYISPVDEDAAQQLEAMKAAPFAPMIDEWRKIQGLPPLEAGAGQVHMVPTLMTPMESFAPTLGSTDPGPDDRVPPPAA